MKTNFKKYILLTMLLSSIVACSNSNSKKSVIKQNNSVISITENSLYTKVKLNEDSKLALLWTQDAGEYKALAYQAFNIAESSINDREIKNVYIDIDDVILDNTPYFAWLLTKGKANNMNDYERWVNSKDAKAVPGSVEFLNTVSAKNIQLYYVTDRNKELYKSTEENLKQLGINGKFEFISKKDALRNIDSENSLFIATDLNSLNPLLPKSFSKRDTKALKMSKDMGKSKILIPNIMYGTYLEALTTNFDYLSSQKQTDVKLKTMHYWKGSKETEINEF